MWISSWRASPNACQFNSAQSSRPFILTPELLGPLSGGCWICEWSCDYDFVSGRMARSDLCAQDDLAIFWSSARHAAKRFRSTFRTQRPSHRIGNNKTQKVLHFAYCVIVYDVLISNSITIVSKHGSRVPLDGMQVLLKLPQIKQITFKHISGRFDIHH